MTPTLINQKKDWRLIVDGEKLKNIKKCRRKYKIIIFFYRLFKVELASPVAEKESLAQNLKTYNDC